MKYHLKPLEDQVVLITGASSGIGLATARMAARRGAALVLAARNEEAIERLAAEIRDEGGRAVAVRCDVGNMDEVRRAAEAAEDSFGGVDTWVNNAGVSIYGRIVDVPLQDMRKLFETNFWGVVNGSIVAVEHMGERGGVLINVGSVLSDRAIPIQGVYSASKFAVRGFTDALRMELEHDRIPIAVTLVKPSSIDTPYREHAANYTDGVPNVPPPVYAPDTVARAILHAAERPVRDLTVGFGGKVIDWMGTAFPRVTDRLMEATMWRAQTTGSPEIEERPDGLWGPGEGLRERGGAPMVLERSAFTRARMSPMVTGLLAVGAGAAAAYALRQANLSRDGRADGHSDGHSGARDHEDRAGIRPGARGEDRAAGPRGDAVTRRVAAELDEAEGQAHEVP
jgi:short-subunit dehydrogenase